MTNLKNRLRKIAQKSGYDVYRLGEAWRRIEPEQLKRFLDRFDIDCVFDVGANEGQYAAALRALGFEGLILSYEPIPQAAEVVRKAAAGDRAWQVFEVALDSEVRQTFFNVMQGSQFSSLKMPRSSDISDIATRNVVSDRLSIRTSTLDQQLPELQQKFGFQRPFLKMDTQGNDVDVVKGAAHVISQFVGLQSELAIEPLYEDMPGFAEALAFYRSFGFKLSALVPNNAGHFPDLIEVDCIMYNEAFKPRR